MKKTGKFVSVILLVLTLLSFINFILAGELQVTEEHPFLVDGEWMPAKELVVGDVMQTIDGKKVRIISIEEVVENESFP